MAVTILDCYTDEPAGLGVPPYLGTYPRYLYGYLRKNTDKEIYYITVDDLRLFHFYQNNLHDKQKTDIKVYNLTKNQKELPSILENTSELYVILGVHTPGKYLSALPGTLHEVIELTKGISCKKILTGPALFGTASEGGKFFEKANLTDFDTFDIIDFSYDKIADYSLLGSEIISHVNDLRIIEIETGRGCSRKKGCSFCTEPLKHDLEFRERNDIVNEIGSFYDKGVRDFRLGKQSCFYTFPDPVKLLEKIRSEYPDIRTLHIDNVNPMIVVTERGEKITQAIVEHCTPGNVAAFGVESFDPDVIYANNLNCTTETVYEAAKMLNKYGKERGENGMPKFLPGINLLYGLDKESRKTHEENRKWLKRFISEDLLLRRINIRQVNIFEGTQLFETVGNKFLKKNKKYYWKWRNDIRQNIDVPMLKKVAPAGTVLKDVRMEIYDGNHTFGRQLGTYPLIVGINKKVQLKKFYTIKVIDHMLRSIVGEVIE